MIFFNRGRVVGLEEDETTAERSKERKKINYSAHDETMFEIARNDSLPIEHRIDALQKVAPVLSTDRTINAWQREYYREVKIGDQYLRIFKSDKNFLIRKEILLDIYNSQDFVWVNGYKRVNKDMTSKYGNMKYAIGELYEYNDLPILCDSGFHFSFNYKDTETSYDFDESILLRVRALIPAGDVEPCLKSDKWVAKSIFITEEVDLKEFDVLYYLEKTHPIVLKYSIFMEHLLNDDHELEKFCENPTDIIKDFTINEFKKYYGETLSYMIWDSLVFNNKGKALGAAFDYMIKYGRALKENNNKVEVDKIVKIVNAMEQ